MRKLFRDFHNGLMRVERLNKANNSFDEELEKNLSKAFTVFGKFLDEGLLITVQEALDIAALGLDADVIVAWEKYRR